MEGSREVAGGQRRRLGKGNQVESSGKGRRRRGDISRASIALSSSEVKQLYLKHQPTYRRLGAKRRFVQRPL